jgi:hypothetical protein
LLALASLTLNFNSRQTVFQDGVSPPHRQFAGFSQRSRK